MHSQETHPFKFYSPPYCHSLIVGTFPPTKKNWSYEFFYPNKQNLFWGIMAQVAGKVLQHFSADEAVAERKEILAVLNTAITDMGLIVRRTNDSSLDENLHAIEYMDILHLLDQHPLINKIIFTSSSGRTSAARWFSNYLKQKNIIHKFPKGVKPLRSEFVYKGRTITLVILYSPSRRAANRVSLAELTNMYRREILDRSANKQ